MDQRFAQKGQIWSDFADEDDKDSSREESVSASEGDGNSEDSENDVDGSGSDASDTELEADVKKSTSNDEGSRTRKADKDKKGSLRKEAMEFRDKLSKRGVIYMSRIPKNMNPTIVRDLLADYGEITRLYLAEDEASARAKAKAEERGAKRNAYFHEGWIEFADKKLAKRVAASLNNTSISNKKKSKYHDELWNLKYLRKFQWDYLTEKFAYERRIREAKIKASMVQAKKDNAEYAELVERGKAAKHALERINDRKRKGNGNADNEDKSVTTDSGGEKKVRRERKFRQNAVFDASGSEQSKLISSTLLDKVWKKKN